MNSMLLLVTIFLALFATKNPIEAFRLRRDVEDTASHENTPSLKEGLDKLGGMLTKLREGVNELCQSGKATMPWCNYKKSLEPMKKSASEKMVFTERKAPRCLPGIPFCKPMAKEADEQQDQNIPRAIARCRQGVAHCPNGKRSIRRAANPPSRTGDCPSGWPFCV